MRPEHVLPLALVALAGCVEDDTPRGREARPPTEDVFFEEPVSIFPRSVGTDAPTLAGRVTCSALEADERVVAVTAAGEAWLAREVSGGVRVRALVPGETAVDHGRLGVTPPLEGGRAWEDGTLAFTAGGRLWRFDGALLEPIRWPEGLPAPRGFCGDPGEDGGDVFVAAGERLFQREEGQWLEWVLPEDGRFPSFGSLEGFAAPEDACRSQDESLFVGSTEGLVWSIARWRTETLEDLEGATALAHDPAFGIAVVVEGELLTGGTLVAPDFTATRFAAGAPEALAAADRTLWVRVGDELYRGRDGELARVEG
ncbi:MAG: hypothetical protein AAGH15_19770, partial [Myxococcota bacterium]